MPASKILSLSVELEQTFGGLTHKIKTISKKRKLRIRSPSTHLCRRKLTRQDILRHSTKGKIPVREKSTV
jgi:hypothetical protein